MKKNYFSTVTSRKYGQFRTIYLEAETENEIKNVTYSVMQDEDGDVNASYYKKNLLGILRAIFFVAKAKNYMV